MHVHVKSLLAFYLFMLCARLCLKFMLLTTASAKRKPRATVLSSYYVVVEGGLALVCADESKVIARLSICGRMDGNG